MSSSLHRLHVVFDDLSVVDEEEELKKDKERKEVISSEEGQKNEVRNPTPIIGPRQLHDNIPFYPATYEPTSGFTGTSYYTEYPFEFPSTVDLMLSTDASRLLASPCSTLRPDPLIPLVSLDSVSDKVVDPMLPQIHLPPIGWQNDMTIPQTQLPAYSGTNLIPVRSTVTPMQMMGKTDSYFHPQCQKMASPTGSSMSSGGMCSFLRRRKDDSRQVTRLQNMSVAQDLRLQLLNSQGEAISKNAWNVTDEKEAMRNGEKDSQDSRVQNQNTDDITAIFSAPERPKHFFAPLPCKLKRPEEESPTASHFGTGTSSSSGRTVSTVISRTNPFAGQKGSADIYVNGAIPYGNKSILRDKDESRTFLSTDNLLIADGKDASNTQLTKSISCQDLSSESQNAAQQSRSNHIDIKSDNMFTKSDNSLDNKTNDSFSRPYKSQLNVTLKLPRAEQTPTPEIPEIPNLPSIDYRLFRNPFLKNFDKNYPNYQIEPNPPATTPLSVQVNDDGHTYQYVSMPAYGTGAQQSDERLRAAQGVSDQNRLLIPSDQMMGGKQDIQVTSFEKPSPCTLIPSAIPYDLTALRGLSANRYLQSQNLYQNVPFVPRSHSQLYSPRGGMMYYDNVTTKVPAQTQTSIDGDSHHGEDEQTTVRKDEGTTNSTPNSPNGQQKPKKVVKKDKTLLKDQRPLSPAAQRRLRKQSSVISTDASMDASPGKVTRKKLRKSSTIATVSDMQEDKNESRSSSSGQDSPRKDRRISIYANSKRRSSQTSLKTTRSGSLDITKDKYTDGAALSSEHERTNSISSRETNMKARKTSISSGNVPWCACWGNGCF